MITKTYISKSNTIIKGRKDNFGLNPIAFLCHGPLISRSLIDFDFSILQSLYDDKTYCNSEHLTHKLIMTNCASIEPERLTDLLPSADHNGVKERATSFRILLFRIPKDWDTGNGFDNSSDFWFVGKKVSSTNGCNWFQRANGYNWDMDGIYTNEFMAEEYEKYANGEESVIIGRQVFEVGNENMEIDITDYVNKVLSGEIENHGIGIMFTPLTENIKTSMTQYVGFFNNNTNTFFQPYILTQYDESIKDDRYRFCLNRPNNLLFLANIGGSLNCLDELPTCTINGALYGVKMLSKGIYCADVTLSSKEYDSNMILSDIWGNIKYNGIEFEDVEMEFVTQSPNTYFNFSNTIEEPRSFNVTLSGINNDERLLPTDKRVIKALFTVPYTKTQYELVDDAKYRVYVKDGDREVTVIDWDNISICGKHNFFTLDLRQFLPQIYHIDVMVDYKNEKRMHKNVLQFKIVSDVTNLSK